AYFKDENGKKLSEKYYRWNFVEEKKYPCNETRAALIAKISKVKSFDWQSFLSNDNEKKLWHILYSISDKKELERMLESDNFKLKIPIEVRREFKKMPPFVKDYGAYSEKAIKKLLPLMRMGKYWSEDGIRTETKERISKIIDGEVDEKIGRRVREKAINLKYIHDFRALPLWLTSYIVYDRHAEEGDIKYWEVPEKIEFLKQHSLRNPIVEQVVNETLRVVKDIWKFYGNGNEKYFDEIHVELGRDMKNPAGIRKQITENNFKNQNTNQRIKNILRELKNQGVENVIPYSPSQQEILKIYEEGVLNNANDLPDEIEKISKTSEPTSKEIEKYKLWMDQKYLSPYTGAIIPLSGLFTSDYEIEHVLPQSRYFDNSLSNKVICEAEVNKLKDNQTGYEFILKHGGEKVDLSEGRNVTVLSKEDYEKHVSYHYKKGSKKSTILLSEEIPEKFIERQLNDTRYISKVIKNLLSNIVREKDEQETTSKNLIAITGSATSILKQDWGLNDIWNELVSPRFKRLNEITNSNFYGYDDNKDGKQFFRVQVPPEIDKGFNKKRIDHRHHAMDALIVACASRNHINYLSNKHARDRGERYDLRNKLRQLEDKQFYQYENGKKVYVTRTVAKEFLKPWGSFTVDTKNSLKEIVVSFKQNIRVINKTTNRYQKWSNHNGGLKKEFEKQIKGDAWAIRKPLHKETVYGRVNLRFIKLITLNKALKDWKTIVDRDLKSIVKDLINKGYDYELLKNYFKSKKYIINEKNVSKVSVYYYNDENAAVR
ncbi:MAG: HNH endonuclease domain-containing protein, partial [Bacteroidota bacterium]|nr:HNH endonuclease domain-containing protein [Bacteroidota bacterium]